MSNPPAKSTGVVLARGLAALEVGQPRIVDECMTQLLNDDPWEWRAVWLAGLGALARNDFPAAQTAFNAVYGQLPGELAPKLALATACELGGELDLAEALYRTCVATDAAYVTPAAFGLARVRAARDDVPGSLTALALVPSTSRGYPESQRMRARELTATAADPVGIEAAFAAIGEARLDDVTATACRTVLYRRAVALLAQGVAVTESGQSLTPELVAGRLADCYRQLGRLSDDQGLRAGYVDMANSLRPWSLI